MCVFLLLFLYSNAHSKKANKKGYRGSLIAIYVTVVLLLLLLLLPLLLLT